MPDDEFLTVEQVARELKVNPETVRGWIRSGELVAIDLGGYRIARSDLNDFLERRKKPRGKRHGNEPAQDDE